MRTFNTLQFPDREVRPSLYDEEQKIFLGISVMLLLAGNFALNYVAQTFFASSMLDIYSPGFWLLVANAVFVSAIFLISKQATGWSWRKLGLARPDSWWKPIVVSLLLFMAVVLISEYLHPVLMSFGNEIDISHLFVINQNLPILILALVLFWIKGAILEELIFRAFLINALDIILGRNQYSTWIAVGVSSLIFGLMYAWQGTGGIMFTASLGLLFGITYILNGRRIWSIIFIHGIIDTISLINIYNL